MPSSLNSVQRSFNSFTFDALLRPKLVPFTSSRKLGSGGGCGGFGVESGFLRPNIFSMSGRESVEAYREDRGFPVKYLEAISPG